MAGRIADRELTLATRAHDAEIRRLLRENPMPGAVALTLEREPDYFRGAGVAGAEDRTIVALENGRVVCMGRCSTRMAWVDGQLARVGYLAELRLDATARGRFSLLRDGYRFFATQDDSELYFTSIAADNHGARRLLERGFRGLPTYTFLAELSTLLIAIPQKPRAGLQLEPATRACVPEMLELLNAHARRCQLAAVWTAETLIGLEKHGLPLHRFLLARERGTLVACGGLWDQRGFRQTVIRGYAPWLAAARPWINAAARWLGTPRLPSVGSALGHAFLSPLAFADGAEALLPDFIAGCFPAAAEIGLEFLTLALPSADARLASLRRRYSTRTWRSRLYRVDFPQRVRLGIESMDKPFCPEVGLL